MKMRATAILSTKMNGTKALAIVAIVAALGAVISLVPIQQPAQGTPKPSECAPSVTTPCAQGDPNPNGHAFNQGTSNAYSATPGNQPPFCSGFKGRAC